MNKGVFGIPVKTENSLKFVGCSNGLEVFQFCDELFSASWKLSIEKKMLKRTLDNLNKIDFYSQQKSYKGKLSSLSLSIFLDEVKKMWNEISKTEDLLSIWETSVRLLIGAVK